MLFLLLFCPLFRVDDTKFKYYGGFIMTVLWSVHLRNFIIIKTRTLSENQKEPEGNSELGSDPLSIFGGWKEKCHDCIIVEFAVANNSFFWNLALSFNI